MSKALVAAYLGVDLAVVVPTKAGNPTVTRHHNRKIDRRRNRDLLINFAEEGTVQVVRVRAR
ncbi:hypothetical protein GCM10009558_051130 [Virgisporangium aurantiacum]